MDLIGTALGILREKIRLEKKLILAREQRILIDFTNDFL